MDEKITISLPNEGDYEISKDVLIKWDFKVEEIYGTTMFCKYGNDTFSIQESEYNKLMTNDN